jgi:hypothetical protein
MAIVTGGRDYTDANRVATVLDAAVVRMGLWCIIEGLCPTGGLDRLAREWAIGRPDISLISVRPGTNWPEAGPIRNAMMLAILLAHDGPKAVIGFPGGRGTANMMMLANSRKAREANVRVINVS